MMRTRLLWFSVGFSFASGAITQFVFKDIWLDRSSFASQLSEKFNSLATRVANLESVIPNEPTSPKILKAGFQSLVEVTGANM